MKQKPIKRTKVFHPNDYPVPKKWDNAFEGIITIYTSGQIIKVL
jgi:hypothetical protein